MKRFANAFRARLRRWFYVLHATWSGIRLVLDPNRLPDVFVLDRAVTTRPVLVRVAARLRTTEHGRRALAERRRLGHIDMNALAALPDGSLGRAYVDYMRARGLDPEAIPRLDVGSELTFISEHLYETHDLWHVVTGFDTDVPGELALQAFYSAQLDGELSRYLIVGGLLKTEMNGVDQWSERVDAIARGWAAGRSAGVLFGVRWDELWATPLEEIRAMLQLTDAVATAHGGRAAIAA